MAKTYKFKNFPSTTTNLLIYAQDFESVMRNSYKLGEDGLDRRCLEYLARMCESICAHCLYFLDIHYHWNIADVLRKSYRISLPSMQDCLLHWWWIPQRFAGADWLNRNMNRRNRRGLKKYAKRPDYPWDLHRNLSRTLDNLKYWRGIIMKNRYKPQLADDPNMYVIAFHVAYDMMTKLRSGEFVSTNPHYPFPRILTSN